ncbi:MAG: hypothetical protein WC457_00845 [Patescibacteria group bacterium]
MNRRRFSITVAAGLIMFLNMRFWHLSWLGIMASVAYLIVVSDGMSRGLIHRFGFENNWRVKLLGALAGIFTLGSTCGVFLVLWQLESIQIFLAMILTGLAAEYLSGPKLQYQRELETGEPLVEIINGKYYVVAFILLIIFGFITLARSAGGISALTPWEIISGRYIYIFYLAVLVLGGLIFSKLKTTALAGMLILISIMMFSYLPLSHKLFWGADGWRHLASIEQVVSGGRVVVTNFADSPNWVERINPGIFSYSQFWSLIAAGAKIFDADLIRLMAWFQPILAGIFFPILFYELALTLGFGRRQSLVFCWLGLLPFAIQAAGGFSLPVNLGFLFFLLFINLLLRRLKNPDARQLPILIGALALSLFGYALFVVLFGVLWLAVEIILRFKNKIENKKTFFIVISAAGFALIIPLLELVAGYAKFNGWPEMLSGVKSFIGNFSGYYLASGPRPHTIDTGNVFFNQIPSYAFVPNGFTEWRWWIVVVMVLMIIGAIFGAIKLLRDADWAKKLIALFGLGIFIGYIISRYFLAGENLLSRRLDAVVAVIILIFLFTAIEKFFTKNLFVSILIIFFGSIAITASYSLGPYSRAVSVDEYEAAKFVWSQTSGESKYCVVGDTYPLLALEAISQKKIIGGGFPIDQNFGQSELVKIYEEIIYSSHIIDLSQYRSKVLELTGADDCYLIIYGAGEIVNKPAVTIGDVVVYNY